MPRPLVIERSKFVKRSTKVHCLDLHPDKTWILTGLHSGEAEIWDYTSKDKIREFSVSEKGHPVCAAKFLSSKHWIICATDQIVIKVFSYISGHRVKSLPAHSDYITCLVIHPGLSCLLSSSKDTCIKMWDWDNWTCSQTFEGHTDSVMQISLIPTENTFASASKDTTAKVWSLDRPHPMLTLEGHTKGVNAVDFFICGDSVRLATASEDSTIRIWDRKSGTCVEIITWREQKISTVFAHPDLGIIVAGAEGGTIRMWNTQNYSSEKIVNYGFGSVCSIGHTRSRSQVMAVGYSMGTLMLQVGVENPIPSMDSNGHLIWWKDSTIQSESIATFESKEGEILPLVGKERTCFGLSPEIFKHNTSGEFVSIYGLERYIICKNSGWKGRKRGSGSELVWSNKKDYAIRDKHGVTIFNQLFQGKFIQDTAAAQKIFGGALLSIFCDNSISFHSWTDGRQIYHIENENFTVRGVYWNTDTDLVAITTTASFSIFEFNLGKTFSLVNTVNERVRSGCWAGDLFIYINSAWRLNCYLAGEVTPLRYTDSPVYFLERPMHMLGYVPNLRRIYLMDKKSKVAHFLESRGMVDEAHKIVMDAEYKLRLAAHLKKLDVDMVAPIHRYIGPSEILRRVHMTQDFEFSLRDNLFRGTYILPAVRDQGNTSTCVFQSVCAAGDIEMARKISLEQQSKSSDIIFSATRFVADYEKKAGPILSDLEHKRFPTALKIFKDTGVYAEGGGRAPQRYKMSSSDEITDFEDVARHMGNSRPVVGQIRIDSHFHSLKEDEIYDYNKEEALKSEDDKVLKSCYGLHRVWAACW